MLKLENLKQDFNLKSKKIYLKIFLVLGIVIIAFVYINKHFNYSNYLKVYGLVKDKNSISLVMAVNDVSYLRENMKLYDKNTEIAYKVVKVEEEAFIVGDKYFKEVLLLVDDLSLFKNETKEFNLLLEEDTIMNYFINLIKGG